MQGGFQNPPVGNQGTLTRVAIKSPNYVLGVTGWSVNKNGTAQFTGLVLIGGTFTGTNFIINDNGAFFYSGTPAAGNLIANITSGGGTDSFGNTYFAGVSVYDSAGNVVELAAGSIFTFNESTGLFANIVKGVYLAYQSGGGPGNLIASVAPAAGTDASGNTYLAGITSQDNATGVVLNLLNGLISIGTQAHINSGLGAFIASAAAAGGILTLDSGKQTAIDQDCEIQIKSAAVSASGQAQVEILGQLLVDVSVTISATGGGMLVVSETGGSPASAPTQFKAASAGDALLGALVTGDAHNRWQMNSNGRQDWGSATAAVDTTLQRGAANQLNVTGADLDIDTAGRGLKIKEGSNAKQGTAVLNGTTAVVVANTSVTATSRIFLTINAPGGTPASPYVFTRTPGTSFSIKSTGASDTSTVAYFITEPG